MLTRHISLLLFCLLAVGYGNAWAQEGATMRIIGNPAASPLTTKNTQADRAAVPFTSGPGEYERKIEGGRKYLLHVPAVYNASRPMPLVLFFARDDTHVLFNGGAGKDAFRDPSKVTDFTSVAETIQRWIGRDGTETAPRLVLDVPEACADLYTSNRNHAQIELVVTETGGHSWPGGRSVRGKNPSRAIIADDVIWEYFLEQVR